MVQEIADTLGMSLPTVYAHPIDREAAATEPTCQSRERRRSRRSCPGAKPAHIY